MKASEFIEVLQEAIDEEGDLEILLPDQYDASGVEVTEEADTRLFVII